MMKSLYLLCVLLTLSGCVNFAHEKAGALTYATTRVTMPSEGRTLRGVAVIMHGLNFGPAHMDDWSELFAKHGMMSVRLVLTGHDGSHDSMKDVSIERWRAEFDDGMRLALEMAVKHDVPLMFLGFSLGGLVGIDWLTRQATGVKVFDKMVLLAPAIATPWYSSMAEFVLAHLDGRRIIPTPSPKRFRAARGSSVHAYRALFELKNSIVSQNFRNANIDTLVLVDRFDELTPFLEIRSILSQHHLSRWQLEPINNRSAFRNHGFRHLIATKALVGDKLWSDLSRRVLSHCGVQEINN